jgi:UDPglucose--hexose-1-phosphate uridylyltransferase
VSGPEPQIRIDQLTGSRVILAAGRADRPFDFAVAPRPAAKADTCPFCEGREDKTPPESWADRPGGGPPDSPGWRVRAVPNLYPALAGDEAGPATGDEAFAAGADPLRASSRGSVEDLFAATSAAGTHEVIVHSPRHVTSLAELSEEELGAAVNGWRTRMREHMEAGAACCQLIVNEGPGAGASLEHSHAQLYALGFVPALIARERERFTAHFQRTQGGGLLSDVAAEEVRRRERLVAIDDEAMLICPWASRGPFELRLIPRRAAAAFEADGEAGTEMLARAYRALTERFGATPELNLWVRTAPRGAEEFQWHIDIAPKLGHKAGFELSTGIDINIWPPEKAAAELRDCLASG